ncbi:MAG: restriction endonuclease subunit S [Patescibacteria group bacterium]
MYLIDQNTKRRTLSCPSFGVQFTGGVVRNLNSELVRNVIIPLPPLEIQKQIVEKIEAERALVEGNKKLIEIYEQKTKEVISKLWEE